MAKRFLRAAAVAERYDATPTTVRRWARDPRFKHLGFPNSYPISDGVEAWDMSELDEFDTRRKALRDGEAA